MGEYFNPENPSNMPQGPKQGFKFSFPRFADEEEDFRWCKAFNRRLYMSIFGVFSLVSIVYFYNLDPINPPLKTTKEIKTVVAQVCAANTKDVRVKTDIKIKNIGPLISMKDIGCEGIELKVRDHLFLNYKNGNNVYVFARSNIDQLCRKTCLVMRDIKEHDLKDCSSKSCIQEKFNTVLREKDNLDSTQPWVYRDFHKLMKSEPEMIQAIYQELVKRYPN